MPLDITLPKIMPAGLSGLAGQLPTLATAPVDPARLLDQTSGASSATKDVAQSFGQLLGQAMQDVNTLHHAADGGAARLAAGEDVDIHQVMIAMEKANISFGLALQVRSKLLEAYQEIMRMNM
jgi:flagellar hook-basal body complex protein FliE